MKKAIEFPYLNLAYNFISRHTSFVYNKFKILVSFGETKVFLTFDEEVEEDIETDFLKQNKIKIKDFDEIKKIIKKKDYIKKDEGGYPVTNAHEIIKLEKTNEETISQSYLVIPDSKASDTETRELLIELCNQNDYKVYFLKIWEKDEEEKGKYIFKLDSINGQTTLPPLSLPSNPQVLWRAPDSKYIYIPYGYTMPLIPDYIEFIKPNQEFAAELDDYNPIQLWQWEDEERNFIYKEYRSEDIDSLKPLANKLRLTSSINSPTISGINREFFEESLEIPLDLRQTTNETSSIIQKVVYSFETEDNKSNEMFLTFLDYAEAGLNDFTYYNSKSQKEGFTNHYFLIDGFGFAEDEMWIGIKKYVLLKSLYEQNLMIFIPADREFFPSIDSLLNGDNEGFIKKLKEELLKIDGNEHKDESVFLIDVIETPKDSNWQITELIDGQPLAKAIKVLIPSFNHENIKKISNYSLLDFSEENNNLQNQWSLAASEDTQNILEETQKYSDELLNISKDISVKMEDSGEKLINFQNAFNDSVKTLVSLPEKFSVFCNNLESDISLVIKDRANWLDSIDEKQQEVHFQIDNKNKIELDIQEKLKEDNEKSMTILSGFIENKSNTEKAFVTTNDLSKELDKNYDEYASLNKELINLFDAKEEYLKNREIELKQIEEQQQKRFEEQNKIDEQQRQKEEELNKIAEEQQKRQEELDKKEKEQKQKQDEIKQTEKELEDKKNELAIIGATIIARMESVVKTKENLEELNKINSSLNEESKDLLKSKNLEYLITDFNNHLKTHQLEIDNINNKIENLNTESVSLQKEKLDKSLINNIVTEEKDFSNFNKNYALIMNKIKSAVKDLETARIVLDNSKLIKDMNLFEKELEIIQKTTKKLSSKVNYINNNGASKEYLIRFKENIKTINEIRLKAAKNQNVQQKIAWWLAWWLGNL